MSAFAVEELPATSLGRQAQLGALKAADFAFPARNPAFPLVVRPAGDARFEQLQELLTEHNGAVRALLHQAGALLVRGFEVKSIEQFESMFASLGIALSERYPLGAAARHRVGQYAWSTTELLDYLPLTPHCEMAYRRLRPRYLGLYCAVAPRKYGETPIFDSRATLADLSPAVRHTLEEGDLTWCHYFPQRRGPGTSSYDRPWPEEFGTEDRAEVERICAGVHARCEWHRNGRLGVLSDTPSIFPHPDTGEETLAFQTPLPEPFLANLQMLSSRQGWPLNAVLRLLVRLKFALFGNPFEARDSRGIRVPDAVFRDVYDALWRNSTVFKWEAGDVLILDNALVHHGRMNIVRPRTVYVALGDMHLV